MKRRPLGLALLALVLTGGCDQPAVTSKGSSDASREILRTEGAKDLVTGPRRRVALVMGNSRYVKLHRLEACKNDAESMARTFRQIGVALHEGKPLLDLTTEQMDSAITGFARSLDASTEAYLYFTGHGAQIGGTNYLLPVNYDAQYEVQAKRQAISLDSILEVLEKTESTLRIVILDACRDPGNLLPGEPVAKGSAVAKGLDEQRVDAPETLVCFATKHGTVALADNDASFYSKALAEEMVKPGTVENVLKIVSRRVYTATEKRQLPFTYGSLHQDHSFVQPLSPSAEAGAIVRSPEVALVPEARQAATSAQTSETAAPVEVAKIMSTRPPLPLETPPPQLLGGSLDAATKSAPYVNELKMEFVPVPVSNGPGAGQPILFSRWETRVKDYQAFVKEGGGRWHRVFANQGANYPVSEVSWIEAKAFCDWLTRKEQRSGKLPAGVRYRLPTDHEWSCAIEIGTQEQPERSPQGKDGIVPGYPWGADWPPPKKAGNLEPSVEVENFETTSPVGSFAANEFGLFDLCGNVWEWCEEWYNPDAQEGRVLRGGSWFDGAEIYLRSSSRYYEKPTGRSDFSGFRCVLAADRP